MSKEKYRYNSGMNPLFLSAIFLSWYCGFLLNPHTASVDEWRGVRVEVRAVRHLGCRKWKLLLLPRVRPSGITRSYAWCVPAGDITIAFENTIRMSVHILIASASTLIVSASALIVWELSVRNLEMKRATISSPVVWFFVVTSSRCHTLRLNTWNNEYYERDNSVTTK